jgi:hypothetical protein
VVDLNLCESSSALDNLCKPLRSQMLRPASRTRSAILPAEVLSLQGVAGSLYLNVTCSIWQFG